MYWRKHSAKMISYAYFSLQNKERTQKKAPGITQDNGTNSQL
jgi:hypothetical protein